MTTTATKPIHIVNLQAQNAAFRGDILAAVERVVDHGQFILGPEVEALEQRFATRCRTAHAVGVSDGTAALTLALRALGLKAGDEVIVPPNSFIASASSVVHAGGRPRFADVGDDYNLDPRSVERAVSERTRGIIAVHLTGRPCAMRELEAIAARHGLWIVEDAAQALGANSRNRPVGSIGRVGCFSLHPLKTGGSCGDGGMVVTNDDALAHKIRLLRNHGMSARQEDCTHWGFNARLDTIQAGIVLAKLPHLDGWIARRRANAEIYRTHLVGDITVPPDRDEDVAVYQTFPILTERRDELMAYLRSLDISTSVHYRVPMHLLDACAGLGYKTGDFPVAESQAERLLSLPVHEGLTDGDILRVCEGVQRFFSA